MAKKCSKEIRDNRGQTEIHVSWSCLPQGDLLSVHQLYNLHIQNQCWHHQNFLWVLHPSLWQLQAPGWHLTEGCHASCQPPADRTFPLYSSDKHSNSLDTRKQALLRYFIGHVFAIAQNPRHRLTAVFVLEIFNHLIFTFVAATSNNQTPVINVQCCHIR